MTDEQRNAILKKQKESFYRKKPINNILEQMIYRENNPYESLLDTPPTDESVKQALSREPPQEKPDLGVRFSEDILTYEMEY